MRHDFFNVGDWTVWRLPIGTEMPIHIEKKKRRRERWKKKPKKKKKETKNTNSTAQKTNHVQIRTYAAPT